MAEAVTVHAVVRLHGLVTRPVVDQRELRGLGCGRSAGGHLSLVIGLFVLPEGLTDAVTLAERPFFITADPDSAACSTEAVLVRSRPSGARRVRIPDVMLA